MKKQMVLQIRREVNRALMPTGIIKQRGPALTIQCLVRKIVKEEMKALRVVSGPEISRELGGTCARG